MEYTKDVIFNVRYAKENAKGRKAKWKKWTSNFLENKKIIATITMITTCLIGLDLILVNSFMQLFRMI